MVLRAGGQMFWIFQKITKKNHFDRSACCLFYSIGPRDWNSKTLYGCVQNK